MNKDKIAKKLRELRGFKPRRIVAQETGISESALANYESGERVPTDQIKGILARYYKVPVGSLFFDEGIHTS